MRRDDQPDQPDPGEVQPTDNSTAAPVDLRRLEDISEERASDGPPSAPAG